MNKPIVREGIRLKPVKPGSLVGATKFNETQAIAEGLANLQVIVKLDGEIISTQSLNLSGRNSVLELDLTGISLTSGMIYAAEWDAAETYEYANVITTRDLNTSIVDPPTSARRSYWLWESTTAGNSGTAPNYYEIPTGTMNIGNWKLLAATLEDIQLAINGQVTLAAFPSGNATLIFKDGYCVDIIGP